MNNRLHFSRRWKSIVHFKNVISLSLTPSNQRQSVVWFCLLFYNKIDLIMNWGEKYDVEVCQCVVCYCSTVPSCCFDKFMTYSIWLHAFSLLFQGMNRCLLVCLLDTLWFWPPVKLIDSIWLHLLWKSLTIAVLT